MKADIATSQTPLHILATLAVVWIVTVLLLQATLHLDQPSTGFRVVWSPPPLLSPGMQAEVAFYCFDANNNACSLPGRFTATLAYPGTEHGQQNLLVEERQVGCYAARLHIPANQPEGVIELYLAFPASLGQAPASCAVPLQRTSALLVLPPEQHLRLGTQPEFKVFTINPVTGAPLPHMALRCRASLDDDTQFFHWVGVSNQHGFCSIRPVIHPALPEGMARFQFQSGLYHTSFELPVLAADPLQSFLTALGEFLPIFPYPFVQFPGRTIFPTLSDLCENAPAPLEISQFPATPRTFSWERVAPQKYRIHWNLPASSSKALEVWQNGRLLLSRTLSQPRDEATISLPQSSAGSAPLCLRIQHSFGHVFTTEQAWIMNKPTSANLADADARLRKMLRSDDRHQLASAYQPPPATLSAQDFSVPGDDLAGLPWVAMQRKFSGPWRFMLFCVSMLLILRGHTAKHSFPGITHWIQTPVLAVASGLACVLSLPLVETLFTDTNLIKFFGFIGLLVLISISQNTLTISSSVRSCLVFFSGYLLIITIGMLLPIMASKFQWCISPAFLFFLSWVPAGIYLLKYPPLVIHQFWRECIQSLSRCSSPLHNTRKFPMAQPRKTPLIFSGLVILTAFIWLEISLLPDSEQLPSQADVNVKHRKTVKISQITQGPGFVRSAPEQDCPSTRAAVQMVQSGVLQSLLDKEQRHKYQLLKHNLVWKDHQFHTLRVFLSEKSFLEHLMATSSRNSNDLRVLLREYLTRKLLSQFQPQPQQLDHLTHLQAISGAIAHHVLRLSRAGETLSPVLSQAVLMIDGLANKTVLTTQLRTELQHTLSENLIPARTLTPPDLLNLLLQLTAIRSLSDTDQDPRSIFSRGGELLVKGATGDVHVPLDGESQTLQRGRSFREEFLVRELELLRNAPLLVKITFP